MFDQDCPSCRTVPGIGRLPCPAHTLEPRTVRRTGPDLEALAHIAECRAVLAKAETARAQR